MRPQSERGRAAMRKTLAAANRGERVPFKIPRSVQQSIPIQRVWQDGIWQVNGRFSQTWRFADINYSLASYEDQRDMFTSYCGVLNQPAHRRRDQDHHSQPPPQQLRLPAQRPHARVRG